MKALDTNVLARWVLRDDPAQALAADALLREQCFASMTVLLELGWVLGRSLRLPRETVVSMLGRILDVEGLTVENAEGLRWAIDQFGAGADWADAVHLVSNAAFATSFVTFDRSLVGALGRSAPIPVSLLSH